jgi:hypothetical protein
MRYKRRPGAIKKAIRHLHPVYQYLCYDGFGFKLGFFDYVKNPKVVRLAFKCHDYGVHVCHQGIGRSLWFVFMDAPERIFAEFDTWEEEYRGDGYSGLGLAITFTNIDSLDFAFEFAKQIPEKYRSHYYQGMIFALAARHMNDKEYFDQQVSNLKSDRQTWIYEALAICDDCFEKTKTLASPYKAWRNCTQEGISQVMNFNSDI